jgi:putrescine transport system substrate-binding protein
MIDSTERSARLTRLICTALAFSLGALIAACQPSGSSRVEIVKSQSSAAAPTASVPSSDEPKILRILNWPDYIAKDLLADFGRETGIAVTYETYENEEDLAQRLAAGVANYDMVVTSSVYAKNQIEARQLRAIDKQRVPGLFRLDPVIMAKLNGVDPGNAHLVPWAWSFTTLGINRAKVSAALGGTPLPANVWSLVFDPAYAQKLSRCGVAYVDSVVDIAAAALHHSNRPAYSNDVTELDGAARLLEPLRPYVKLASGSDIIEALSSGRICVAMAWAGDINIARGRAIEKNTGQRIEVLLPPNGALIFFDAMAIPANAPHPMNAMAFMEFFLRPHNSAALTNELGYPTANRAAAPLINPDVANDTAVAPPAEVLEAMIPPGSFSPAAREYFKSKLANFTHGL